MRSAESPPRRWSGRGGDSALRIPHSAFASVTSGYLVVPSVRLFYREVGQGPPVVFVHGGPGLPHEQLLPHCDRLAGRFRLVYYDQRGCGRSGDPEPPEALTWQDHVADLAAILAGRAGRPVALVGFSWGA